MKPFVSTTVVNDQQLLKDVGKRKTTFFSTFTSIQSSEKWKPPALRAPVLILTTLVCWALITVLQYLLTKIQRDNGVIFAARISELPLSRTFLYLYFPTITAVIFSIHWTWIDVETKRVEPYYQLSKKEGALGKDSLLLEYPFHFIPLVPLKALKDRHWPVFWASFAIVIVTLGLVPTQAGIFSIKTITRSTSAQYDVSTSSIPVSEQAKTLTYRYAQSTYGIVVLNETLPPFMALNYTLRPFGLSPASQNEDQLEPQNGTWTAPTTMYFLDLYCEDVSHKAGSSGRVTYVSSGGCNFTLGLQGNATINPKPDLVLRKSPVKEFTGMYVGYENGGFADYSLDASCKGTANNTFYAAFQRNKKREADPPNGVTAVYCSPRYWQQDVVATVDMRTKHPLKIEPVADKQRLASDLFNITLFDMLLNANTALQTVRADVLPANSFPKYLGPVADTELSLMDEAGGLSHTMVGFASLAGGQPLDAYLDWKALSKSYADAYRVMFARAMVEVLNSTNRQSSPVIGHQRVTIEAVVLEPVFVYIVEAFLGVLSLCAVVLLYLSITRNRDIYTDPGTIASIMSLVADSGDLLADFQNLDCCTTEELKAVISEKRFKLVDCGSRTSIAEIDKAIEGPGPSPLSRRETEIAAPVRPYEFNLLIGCALASVFLGLAVGLAVLFVKANNHGLALPSSNTIVQNILENYIPTAIATLIEPIWILINRLLCMLQPIEELRDCNARAEHSIDLRYSSLPPQLVIFKAIRAKHFVLVTVCVMGILANILAVALAGVFQQASADIWHATPLNYTLGSRFVSINGSIGPNRDNIPGMEFGLERSGAFNGGDGMDQFLVADANATRGAPLPAWVDKRFYYQPFSTNVSTGSSDTVEAKTPVFGAELECSALDFGDSFSFELNPEGPKSEQDYALSFNLTITKGLNKFQCTGPVWRLARFPRTGECAEGKSATELVSIPKPRNANASRAEEDVCRSSVLLGWLRMNSDCNDTRKPILAKENATFLLCQPKLVTGNATIRVDTSGRTMSQPQDVDVREMTQIDAGRLFENDPVNLIRQSNMYLFRTIIPGWHNDSLANDILNYFLVHTGNSSRLVDPSFGVPKFEDIVGPLNKVYSGLFAIWLAINKDKLFTAQSADRTSAKIQGWRIASETRIFVLKPMFIMAEVILITYVFVTLLVYAKRPGRFLPRLPTSVAATIALFAASSAVMDMRDTSHLDRKGRAKHLKNLDSRYGYGSYIGAADGRVHIGVEKSPFVRRRRPKSTWLEKRVATFRHGSPDDV